MQTWRHDTKCCFEKWIFCLLNSKYAFCQLNMSVWLNSQTKVKFKLPLVCEFLHWKDIGINLDSLYRQIWYENFYLFSLLLNIQYVCELNNKRVVLLMKYKSLYFHCFRHTTTIQIQWMANTWQWSVGLSFIVHGQFKHIFHSKDCVRCR